MENPFAGAIAWYQGLPQAAQIGIPIVGAGAVILIAKGKGGTGSLVSGPFGSSVGGGVASGGGTSGGGGGSTVTGGGVGTTTGGTSTGGGSTPGKPKPTPSPTHTGGASNSHPTSTPTSGVRSYAPARPVRNPVPTAISGTADKPRIVATPSTPIASIRSGMLYEGGPSSPAMVTKALAPKYLPQDQSQAKVAFTAQAAQANTLAAAITPKKITTTTSPLAGIRSGSLYEGGSTKVTPSKVTPAPAVHPVSVSKVRNPVAAAKTHQTVNDKNRAAVTKLATSTGKSSTRVAL